MFQKSLDGCGQTIISRPKQNIVKDYNLLQGTYNPAELINQPPRDINTRYIRVENGSAKKMAGIAITTNWYLNVIPPIQRILYPQEILHLGVNLPEMEQQFLWILHPETKMPIGGPTPLSHNANSFILREGVNKWNVDKFKFVPYKG